MPSTKELNRVEVIFEYTTFHAGSRFVARTGKLVLESGGTAKELSYRKREIKQLCVNFVLSKKPKWNIFMLDIKSITDSKRKLKK